MRSLETTSQSWYLDPLVARQKGAVFLDWIRRSMVSRPAERVLKTDVFEEANGQDRILHAMFPGARLRVGIDIDESTVRKAKRAGNDFPSLCTDVRLLPFASESFDLVVSTSTLDHFEDPTDLRCALRELIRVLQPGGALLVILDNPYNPMYHPLKWITRRGWAPFRLGHTMSLRQLAAELDSAGLEIQSKEYLIHNPRLISTAVYLGLRRALGGKADRPIFVLLSLFEMLGRLPTRFLTGCFSAVSARKSS